MKDASREGNFRVLNPLETSLFIIRWVELSRKISLAYCDSILRLVLSAA